MRSDQQTDVFRDDPIRIAQAWRIAAETSRQQYPDRPDRADYYTQQAERLERSAEAQNG